MSLAARVLLPTNTSAEPQTAASCLRSALQRYSNPQIFASQYPTARSLFPYVTLIDVGCAENCATTETQREIFPSCFNSESR